jgi:CubicO group peptidase (beta-lactamase class C family)
MFEPGTDFSYANTGINSAARIIEVVSGMKFEDFLQKRLFGHLGMTDTTFWPNEAQVARLAKSYRPNPTQTDLLETPITQLYYPLTDHVHRYPVPAGGLFSTASDLMKFCQMLLNDGEFAGTHYVSAKAIREMTRTQWSDPSAAVGDGYGLGWSTHVSGVYEHGGAYATNMKVDPARGLITIWLIQHAGFPGDGAKSQAAFEKAAAERN